MIENELRNPKLSHKKETVILTGFVIMPNDTSSGYSLSGQLFYVDSDFESMLETEISVWVFDSN